MSDNGPSKGRYFWERFALGDHSGAQLAALRRGLGVEVGMAPEMWTYYTTLEPDGRITRRLRAEHAALGLFAIHQQSESVLVHRAGIGMGTALRSLRNSGRFGDDALDARVERATRSSDLGEVTYHLRGLVRMFKDLSPPLGLDYTQLMRDLIDWQDDQGLGRARRRWGLAYAASTPLPSTNDSRQEIQ